MSQATAGVAWRLGAQISELFDGSTVGWAVSVRSGATEVAALAGGWSRAPWETSGGVAMTPDTPIHIASMSKIVTSLALYQMINQWNAAVQGQVWTPTGPLPPSCRTSPWSNSVSEPPLAVQTAEPGPLLPLCQLARRSNFELSTATQVMALIGDRVPAGPGVEAITLYDIMLFQTGIDMDTVPGWDLPAGESTTALWTAISNTFEQGVAPGNAPGQAAGAEGYHNQNYEILRGVIENCVGMSYDLYCQLYVWPLISGSGYTWPSMPWEEIPAQVLFETYRTTLYPSPTAPVPPNQPQCYLPTPATSCLTYGLPAVTPGWVRSADFSSGGMQTDFRGQAGAYGWYASVRDMTALLLSASTMLGSSDVTQIWADPSLGQGIPGPDKTWGHNGGWNINGQMSSGWAFVSESGLAVAFMINSNSLVTDSLTPIVSALQPLTTVDPPQLEGGLPAWSFPACAAPVHSSQGVQVRNPYGYGTVLATQTAQLPTSTSPAVPSTPQMIAASAVTVTAAVFDGSTQVSLSGQIQANAPTVRPANAAPANLGLNGGRVPTGPGVRWRLQHPPSGQTPPAEFQRVPGFETPNVVTANGTTPVPEPSAVGAQTGGYAVLFEAYLDVPSPGGVYQFDVTSADGSVLWIGDEKVVDNDGPHGSQTVSGTAHLAAGYHPFRLGYFLATSTPALGVNWSQPGVSQPTAIPASAFVLPPTYVDAAIDAPASPAPGLYWSAYTSVAAAISGQNRLPRLDSDCQPCAAGVSSDANVPDIGAPGSFAIAWSGLVSVPADGEYTFSLDSDDGSRLWVSGLLVVDDDGAHGATTASGTVSLKQGLHRLQLEYFQAGGYWSLQTTWPSGTSLVRDPGPTP